MNIFEMTDTWNDAGATFAGIRLDVTDTASAAGSALLDLRLGGAARMRVEKNGAMTVFNTLANEKILVWQGGNVWVGSAGAGFEASSYGGTLKITNSFATFGGNIGVRLGGSTGQHVALHSDVVGQIDQRNGTAAQAFNIYNTYTDASNYERGGLRWVGNDLELFTEGAGTGTKRSIHITGPMENDGDAINKRIYLGSQTYLYEQFGNLFFKSVGNGFGFLDQVAFSAEVLMSNLPTTDPATAGRLWNDAGTLKISAG